MTAALIDFPEIAARDRLREAQAALASALAAADAASQSLARGKETLDELQKRRAAAHAEIADEARTWTEAIEAGAFSISSGGAVQKRREVDDERAAFEISFDILLKKNTDAQRAVVECEAVLAAAVKSVVAEEVSPLLARMEDCERAAAHLKSQLRALQYCGRWGLCPENLPRQLLREPVNVHHADQPLTFDQQKLYDKR